MRDFDLTEHTHVFYPDPAEQYMRQQGMREHLGEYLTRLETGLVNPGLRPYQELGFPCILKKVYDDLDNPIDLNAEPGSALDQLSHPQIAEAAMGYGKSFLLAHLAVATGIGQLPYEGAEEPLRALYISYTKRGVGEIVKACKKFTPDLKVARYSTQRLKAAKELEQADVVVISYAALSGIVRKRLGGIPTLIDGRQFDLIGSDENHHRWAPKFGYAVDAYARGKVEVGMTGTRRITERNKDVPVSFRFSARDMIDTGHAPSVQMLAFPTGKHISAGIRTPRDPFKAIEKPYTWKELQPLALDAERNYQIVELLKLLASHGHTILGGMIAGARCTHGNLVKALVNKESIVDPVTHKRRELNFEAVDGYMKDDKIDDLLERAQYPFHESGLDGLLSTSLLTESVDNTNFTAAVAGSPMPFIQLAQFAGRLSRGEPTDTVVIAQLIDRANNTRAPAFIGDVYEEGGFFNGMVIGRKDKDSTHIPPLESQRSSGNRPRTGRGVRSAIILEEIVDRTFSQRLDALDAYLDEWRNEPIYDETLKANCVPLSKPPRDSVKITDLYELPNIQSAGMDEASFYALLRENGFRYSKVETDAGLVDYVHQAEKAASFLENYQFRSEEAPKRYTLQVLGRIFSASSHSITQEIARLEAAGEDLMPEVQSVMGKKDKLTYSERQKELIGKALEQRQEELVPETEGHPYERLQALARELRIYDYQLKRFVRHVRGSQVMRFLSRESEKRLTYVQPQDALAARFHYSLDDVPDEATLLKSIGKKFNTDEAAVARAFESIGKKELVQQGRHFVRGKPTDGEGGTEYGEGFQLTYPLFCTDPDAITAVQRYMRVANDSKEDRVAAEIPATAHPQQPSVATTATEPRSQILTAEVAPTFEMPPGYKNVAQALEARRVPCDPELLGPLIERVGRYSDAQRDRLGEWYLDESGIDAVTRHIQNIPVATSAAITLDELVTHCARAGIEDIIAEDILNLYQAAIEGRPPLSSRGRITALRTVPAPGRPSILRVHFRHAFVDEVVERLFFLGRTLRLPKLRAMRR